MDFIKTSEAFSVLPLVEKYHNLLVLHSLTKFYAIPGLRLGFAATDHEVLDPLYAAKDIWNVNSLAPKRQVWLHSMTKNTKDAVALIRAQK